ncbi:MAG: Flp family type IVb pilin [Amaricoccus sp.]
MTAWLTIGGALAVEEDGATSIEYALLAAMIAAVLITIVSSMGTTVGGIFTAANTDLITYMPASAP